MVKTGHSSIFRDEEINQSRSYRSLSLLNGVLTGLALALGAWGYSVYTQLSLPTSTPFVGVVAAGLLVAILTGATGWLTARTAKTWFTIVLWLLVAGFSVLIIGFEATHLRTFSIWLADSRFWGLPIYPSTTGSILLILVGGFFAYLTFGVLAFMQDYRLEGIHSHLGPNKGLSFTAVLFLCLPLPFVVVAGFITNDIVGGANTSFAIEQVHEVIQTGRTYEGDLFQLSRERGINYNAIRGVREMMSDNYTLAVTGFDAANVTVIVTAEFDNGAWIDCRVINEQISFCFDASPPYTIGFASLITGEELPENCAGCQIQADDTWRSWLRERNDNFDSNPQIEKVVQRGIYTLMRAESADGGYALECWFARSGVIELDNCFEATAE